MTSGTARDAARGSIVAQLVPGARIVKAANTYPAEVLGAEPREAGGRRVLLLSGPLAGHNLVRMPAAWE